MLAGVLCTAILTGCGGGSDTVAAPTSPTVDIGQSVSAVIDYISNMIASFSENSDAVDVNALTLAVDDTAEPAALK